MDHHPTPAELEGLVFGRISAERSRIVVGHLLHGCRECRGALEPYIEALKGDAQSLPLPKEESYDDALDRAFASVRGLGVALPPVKVEEGTKQEVLDLFTTRGLEAIAEAPYDFQPLPLFEALLERSWALRHDDPEQMVQLSRFATMLAERLDANLLGTKEVADLQCRAWTELGNAYRVADELSRAEDALGRATELLVQGNWQ